MAQCGGAGGETAVRSKSIPSLRIQRKSSSDSHAEGGCAEIARTSAAHPPKRTRQQMVLGSSMGCDRIAGEQPVRGVTESTALRACPVCVRA